MAKKPATCQRKTSHENSAKRQNQISRQVGCGVSDQIGADRACIGQDRADEEGRDQAGSTEAQRG